ncbi:L-lactate dehydrogenase [Lactobacillus delbrueckii subsp. lactis]|uniref:L-lactate dehydrogenase n=1 Tax=Lactobacillus leichmannii TaxID=28039 RepID=A0ABT1XYX4_LACLE|nr:MULTISPECIES: L-lactate dehydrogenase [Lactobacillus]APG67742.1 L-lactate dehydrogenase [Lactobacillus delbrueckii subsp. lactis]MCD5490238.1 L-lactate dehydrogenase [Lactobacillus delbrueckii subsp. lactis]MCD5495622.1 L-lactate dehydrogenase [Lactobacillus delbrueckii subsp. lactis]MCD5497473.1 L-lactate dehydrogenase [Lactobacillus delbrueckii subsp. lactis]MCD5499211.1 L-lactate dehydrogenase [Lactobacillus delbrueckii subsp. lactis]
MRKVAVIGMGHVGATAAFILFTHGVADELVLLDKNETKCRAEWGDLRDTLGRNDFYVNVKWGDWKELADADLIITAFGDVAASITTGDRFAEFPINTKNAVEVGQKIKDSGFKGVIINISNPCDVVTSILQKVTGLPKSQVFGTGTFLDTSRMQRVVGEKLGQDPRNVSGFNLGEHGSSQFTAWSTVWVNNRPAKDLFNEAEKEEMDRLSKDNAFMVGKGKGYTCYAVATCAVRLARAVFSDAKFYGPTSCYVESLGTYIGYPSIVGKHGVEEVPVLDLPADEQDKLEASAKKLKDSLASLE